LAPGEVEPVRRRVLVEQLGPRLARELGLMQAADDDRERRTLARDQARKGRHEASGGEDGEA
jgi:hypothetical protein